MPVGMNRMTVDFSDAQSLSLERTAGTLNETKVSVIRMALALMEIALREQRAGNAIGIVRGERVVKEISPMWSLPPVVAI